jgi:hypothetical protein
MSSIATANLVAEGPQELLSACRRDLAVRIDAIKLHMVTELTSGVAHGIFGVVIWPGCDSCWYARSERRYTVKKESEKLADARRVERPVQARDGTRSLVDDMITRARTRRVVRVGIYEQMHVLKEVHLMDARQVRGIPFWLKLPVNVRDVVLAIPRFLHGQIGTVYGTMIREREISWKIGELSLTREMVRPQRRILFDPAIVLGNSIVLTGWETHDSAQPGWWMKLDNLLNRYCGSPIDR